MSPGRISQPLDTRNAFFRVSQTAAILTQLLLSFEHQGEALIWLRLAESGAYYVALFEVFLDVTWLFWTRLSFR